MDGFDGENVRAYKVVYFDDIFCPEPEGVFLKQIAVDRADQLVSSSSEEERSEYSGDEVENELEIYLDAEIQETARLLESDQECSSELEEDFVGTVAAKRGRSREGGWEERDDLVSTLTELSISSSQIPRSECMRKFDTCFDDLMRGYN